MTNGSLISLAFALESRIGSAFHPFQDSFPGHPNFVFLKIVRSRVSSSNYNLGIQRSISRSIHGRQRVDRCLIWEDQSESF